MRLIDADATKENCRLPTIYDLNDVPLFLDDQPTVDAVPVVRCGECRFRCCNNKCILDDPPRRDFDDDDFCSQGEKMEDDDEKA